MREGPSDDVAPPPGRATGRKRTQFARTYSDAELEHIVRSVVESIDADQPQRVTPTAFDEALTASEWADAPKAASIRRRWRIGWYETLALIFDPSREIDDTITARRRRAPRVGLTEEEIVYALKLVAAHLHVTTLRPDDYNRGRSELQAIARRRFRHGDDRSYLLPTAADIEQALGRLGEAGWDEALEVAGLERRPVAGGKSGLSVEEALERFLEDIGCLAWSGSALRTWASTRQISVQIPATPFAEAVAAFITTRVPTGRWTPLASPPAGKRPPIYASDDSSRNDGDPSARRRDSFRGVLRGVVQAYLALPPGEKLTLPVHRDIARGRPDITGPSKLGRRAKKYKTTAAEIRREAEQIASSVRRGGDLDALLDEAVARQPGAGVSIAELAGELGVPTGTLRRWHARTFPRPTGDRSKLLDVAPAEAAAARAWAAQLGPAARNGDREYALSLCDKVLGEAGVRNHKFEWLRTDVRKDGKSRRLPLDLFYPSCGLVVEYRLPAEEEEVPTSDQKRLLRRYAERRDREIPAHGLSLVVIRPKDLAYEPGQPLLHDEAQDRATIRRLVEQAGVELS